MDGNKGTIPSDSSPRRNPEVLLLLLAGTAGSMDAITFLGLGHVFPANMTGNTVLLGLAVSQADTSAALRALTALGGFVLGAAVGTLSAGPGPSQGRWTSSATRTIRGEAALLAVLAVAWYFIGPNPSAGREHALIGLSGLAMGMQSAAIRHVNMPGVSTTYITGTLTTLVAGAVNRFQSSPSSVASPSFSLGLLASILMVYGLAALTGGLLAARWPSSASFLPMLILALVAALGTFGHWDSPRRYR